MASHSAELALASRFLQLAQRYDQRPNLARQSTLPTLTRFLYSNDRATRKVTLEAVQLLAEHPENIDLLARNADIVQGVVHVYRESQFDDPELCECASLTLDALAPALTEPDPRKAEVSRRAGASGRLSVRESSSRASETPPPTASLGPAVDLTDFPDSASDDAYARGLSPSVAVPPASRGVGSHTSLQQQPPQQPQQPPESQKLRAVQLRVPALRTRPEVAGAVEEVVQCARGIVDYTMQSARSLVCLTLSPGPLYLSALMQALNEAGFSNSVESDTPVGAPGGAARSASTMEAHRSRSSAADRQLPWALLAEVMSRFGSWKQIKAAAQHHLQRATLFSQQLWTSFCVYSDPANNVLRRRVQHVSELMQSNPCRAVLAGERIGRAIALWW